MAVKIRTAEAPDTQEAKQNVRSVQEQARQAEDRSKQLELLLREAQAAAERRDNEKQKAASLDQEIGEVSAG